MHQHTYGYNVPMHSFIPILQREGEAWKKNMHFYNYLLMVPIWRDPLDLIFLYIWHIFISYG